MRIAVTGKTGQVARALFEAAKEESDIEIVLVGRPELDLAERKTVIAALDAVEPDLIVNAAAYTAVDRAEAETLLATAINADGAGVVARAAKIFGVPLIHLSTDYVYDGKKEGPYIEGDPPFPLNIYGETKLLGEYMVRTQTRNSVILRTSWVYAPYGKNFVRTITRLIRKGVEEIRVVDDQFGTPTYAPDLARAIFTIARNLLVAPFEGRGLYHYSGAGETVSWAGFAKEILTRLDVPGPAIVPISSAEYGSPVRRPANSRLDCMKLAFAHGVVAPDWRDSLAFALEPPLNV